MGWPKRQREPQREQEEVDLARAKGHVGWRCSWPPPIISHWDEAGMGEGVDDAARASLAVADSMAPPSNSK